MVSSISKKLFILLSAALFFSVVGFNSNASASVTSSDETIIQLAQSTPTGLSTITRNDLTGYDGDNAFVGTLCNIFRVVTGNGGKAFAAFAIISLGIGFFTGKVSWGLMLGVAAGIAAMFGAPTIVAAIAGGTAFDCKNT